MKAIIFARVSSREQEEGHSLDAQIQRCFEYAIKRDFKVIEQFRVVESTLSQGRPEFAKLVDVTGYSSKENQTCPARLL